MALDATKWQVQTNKAIRYIGGDHGTATTNYVTVLELHRWLQDLADEASVQNDDYLDITTVNPSDKKFDTIITLTNSYTLDDAYTTPASEFIYGGSILQGSGGTETIYDGIRVVAPLGVYVNVIQDNTVLANNFWNSVPSSSRTDSTANASGTNTSGQKVLNVTDGTLFEAGDTIMIGITDPLEYVIDSISTNALTLTENLGSNANSSEDIYFSTRGLNPDGANGVAMQFMVKVKDTGTVTDNGALLFTTREWFRSYSEFRIPSTGRGVNVVPLTYVSDLNNTTAIASLTLTPFDGISNTISGWNEIDVNQDTTFEEYYSAWDRGSATINQFYERMKYITRRGETTTQYGIAGELLRGITHQVAVTGQGVTDWAAYEEVSWGSGATVGTGQMLAVDDINAATTLWLQLLTGVAPSVAATPITGTGGASATISSVTERTTSTPFCGASTGSSLVGAYGFSLEYADLAVNDKIQALDGITRQPPNNVTFTVAGVKHDWRVLVGPEDGSAGLLYTQLSNTNLLSTGTEATVEVDEPIPANTPSSGNLRIQRNNGSYTLHTYSSVNTTTKVFTFTTTQDFSTGGATFNAAIGANIFISYIDATVVGPIFTIASSTFTSGTLYEIKTPGDANWVTMGASDSDAGTQFTSNGTKNGTTGDAYQVNTTSTYNTIQTATQTLFIEARFGGTGDYTNSIKPAKTTGTLNSTGGSATISAVSDA
jgi:hypothetical protein